MSEGHSAAAMNRTTRQTAGRIRSRLPRVFPLVLFVHGVLVAQAIAAPSEGNADWAALPGYRHGDDLAALLAIEQEAIASMATPTARAACAARLAAVLEHPGATPAAKQWVCLMLRQVGTPAEVPRLARELSGRDIETADTARQAIESIPGDASASALRDFLPRAEGTIALGVIATIGRRRDAAAVPLLGPLAAGDDPLVAKAAANALGLIGTPPAIARLRSLGEALGAPTPPWLCEPLLRAAESASQAGAQDSWRSINELLSSDRQPAAVRQAALKQLLDTTEGRRSALIGEWLDSTDPDRRQVAAGAVGTLDELALTRGLETLDSHPPQAQMAILTVASAKIPRKALPVLNRLVSTDSGDLRVTAIECLGRIGAAECLPPLLAVLAEDAAGEGVSSALNAARNAIVSMPREVVGPRLVEMLTADSQQSAGLISLIGEIREPTAWDALATIALARSPAPWQVAIDSLSRIARPEDDDLARLVDVFFQAQEPDRRDALARMIAAVAKHASSGDPTGSVISALDRRNAATALTLPLIGRLGGDAALARLDDGLRSSDSATRAAAIDGLCNWPNASVADRLLTLCSQLLPQPESHARGRQALRAYVRVVSLKSERSAEETLALLQAAMALAADGPAGDREYVLERTAAAVRSMDAVEWIAAYLDDPSVAQAACRAIVTLAHHRTLRQPNSKRFGELLDRVADVTTDPVMAVRAKRYTLGL